MKILSSSQKSKIDSFSTKSAKIRFLHSEGWSRGEISKFLEIRYQHVRNVLITPVVTPKESF